MYTCNTWNFGNEPLYFFCVIVEGMYSFKIENFNNDPLHLCFCCFRGYVLGSWLVSVVVIVFVFEVTRLMGWESVVWVVGLEPGCNDSNILGLGDRKLVDTTIFWINGFITHCFGMKRSGIFCCIFWWYWRWHVWYLRGYFSRCYYDCFLDRYYAVELLLICFL